MKNLSVWEAELKDGREKPGNKTDGPEFNWPTPEDGDVPAWILETVPLKGYLCR